MKCEMCDKYEATRKDYRTIDGMTSSYGVCGWCYGLDDVAIYRIRNENVNPLNFYDDDIHYEKLSDKELAELHIEMFDKIREELEDNNSLRILVATERELTLREEQPK